MEQGGITKDVAPKRSHSTSSKNPKPLVLEELTRLGIRPGKKFSFNWQGQTLQAQVTGVRLKTVCVTYFDA
jgi:hypothetical protein